MFSKGRKIVNLKFAQCSEEIIKICILRYNRILNKNCLQSDFHFLKILSVWKRLKSTDFVKLEFSILQLVNNIFLSLSLLIYLDDFFSSCKIISLRLWFKNKTICHETDDGERKRRQKKFFRVLRVWAWWFRQEKQLFWVLFRSEIFPWFSIKNDHFLPKFSHQKIHQENLPNKWFFTPTPFVSF